MSVPGLATVVVVVEGGGRWGEGCGGERDRGPDSQGKQSHVGSRIKPQTDHLVVVAGLATVRRTLATMYYIVEAVGGGGGGEMGGRREGMGLGRVVSKITPRDFPLCKFNGAVLSPETA